MCLIAALALLFSTYLMYWFSATTFNGTIVYANGIGYIKNFVELWTNPNTNCQHMGLPFLALYYVFLVIFFILLISPILLIIGMKKRVGALLGSIVPLTIGIFIVLFAFFGFAPFFIKTLIYGFGDIEPLVLLIGVEGHFELFGAYALIICGILGLIAAKIGPGDK